MRRVQCAFRAQALADAADPAASGDSAANAARLRDVVCYNLVALPQ